MRRFILIVTIGVLPYFGGPCLPSGYFSNLLASSMTAVVSALLSDVMNTVFPRV